MRYYGWYSNRCRGLRQQRAAGVSGQTHPPPTRPKRRRTPWRELIKQVYPEVSRLLQAHFPDRYQRLPFAEAWRRIWQGGEFIVEEPTISQGRREKRT